MSRLVEWFFSLFISKHTLEEFRKEEAKRLRKEYTDYKNKVYFDKLRKRCH